MALLVEAAAAGAAGSRLRLLVPGGRDRPPGPRALGALDRAVDVVEVAGGD